MVVKGHDKIMLFNKPFHGLVFYLTEGPCTSIDLAIWISRRSFAAPHTITGVSVNKKFIVSVVVYTKSSIAVVSSVFSPKTTSIWIGFFVVKVSVRVYNRDKVKFGIINNALDLWVCIIIL